MCAAFLLPSCVAPAYVGPNQAAGSVIGAGLGAIAGGIIGHQTGCGLEGAALGGLWGSWAGSSLGYSRDSYEYGCRQPYYGGYYSYPPPPPVVVYGGYRSCAPRHYHQCR